MYFGLQVYHPQQAFDYVPFPQGVAPYWIPSVYIGLTNGELIETFGTIPGLDVAPENVFKVPRIHGVMG